PVVTPLPSAGPYALTSVTPTSWSLTRNPFYRGDRPAGPDEIAYQSGVDPESEVVEIESGVADFSADGVAPDQTARLFAQYGPGTLHQRLFVTTALETIYVALNTSRPLFSDPTIREAVNEAIDRPALVAAAGTPSGAVSDQVLPPGMPGYAPLHRYALDG